LVAGAAGMGREASGATKVSVSAVWADAAGADEAADLVLPCFGVVSDAVFISAACESWWKTVVFRISLGKRSIAGFRSADGGLVATAALPCSEAGCEPALTEEPRLELPWLAVGNVSSGMRRVMLAIIPL